MEFEQTLVCDESAPGIARSFVIDYLDHSDCSGLNGDASLLISELVTNAIRHADCLHAELHVRIDVDGVSIGVTDDSSSLPVLRQERPSFGGLGLRIVDQIAQRWWCEPSPQGKTVWFTLR